MERSSDRRGLLGRRTERAALDALIAGIRDSRSGSVVLHGEPGIGKTALLDYVRGAAAGCRLAAAAGVESEVELAFGGLHQLCAPFLGRLDGLADPQRVALETAFGLSAGSPPDRFLVGLAVLSLLADVAEDEPLVCLVDDAQWLDQISGHTLAFVARRLLAERVLLVFAMRDPVDGHALQGLPQLQLAGLDDRDARALLHAVSPRQFDPRVRDRLLAEARGNPLALLEMPRALTTAELERPTLGGGDEPFANQLEGGFLRRVRALSPETQRLLLVAAAEPVGDVLLLRRAAEALGIDLDEAGAEAEAADLLTIRTLVRFRHPLVRSAAYGAAPGEDRRAAHRVLAEVTDPRREPDRRAWHLASAVVEPDETVAVMLEQAAGRARARGGVGAAAAFLDRAAQLTPDPARRGRRTLDAAEARNQAGGFGQALDLLDDSRLLPLDEHDLARADLLRGQVLSGSRSASAGLPLLLAAAKRLEGLDPRLARETYRDALYAAFTAGRLPGGESLESVAAAVVAMAASDEPSRADLLLEGAARIYTDGYATGAPLLQQALAAYRAGGVSERELGWLPLASRMAHNVWDLESWSVLSTALVDRAREAGALSVLPSALLLSLSVRAQAGDFAAAQSMVDEAETIGDVTGSSFFAHYGALVVAGWRGGEADVSSAIATITHDPLLRTEGKVLTATEWAAAVLNNGLGRHEEAYAAAQRGSAHPQEMGLAIWSMVELVEAAARLGRTTDADPVSAALLVREQAATAQTDWALGTASYVDALLHEGPAAEADYRQAIERLQRTDARFMTARAHLVYGEWLRRVGRQDDARHRLGVAHDLLTQIGNLDFVERARRELVLSGVPTRRPEPTVRASLTAQEAQIARLAAAGMTNPEIGAQLFISSHTVEWHLRKVFAKLGIRSRRDINRVLPQETQARSAARAARPAST